MRLTGHVVLPVAQDLPVFLGALTLREAFIRHHGYRPVADILNELPGWRRLRLGLILVLGLIVGLLRLCR